MHRVRDLAATRHDALLCLEKRAGKGENDFGLSTIKFVVQTAATCPLGDGRRIDQLGSGTDNDAGLWHGQADVNDAYNRLGMPSFLFR